MAPRSPATPTISVIVATRNRQVLLRDLLDALRRSEDAPPWELIVADNGSNDGTAELLESAADDLPLARVSEMVPGKSRALNRAMAQARGEIFLFTDDDARPDPQWLNALVRAALSHPQANVFGGRVRVRAETMPSWLARSYNLKTMLASEQDFGNEPCWFAPDQYPVGPNLAVRRRCLQDRRYGWPTNLGPGTKIPLGDEKAFLMQISGPDAVDRLYVPDSVVWHNPQHRTISVLGAVHRCFLGGYAAGLIGKNHPARPRNSNFLNVTRQRFGAAKSVPEIVCMTARALGVVAGTTSPFAEVVYG